MKVNADYGESSFGFQYFSIAGFGGFLLLNFFYYLKSQLEYATLKKWSNGLFDPIKRKDDNIIVVFEQSDIMVSYTNNILRKAISIYLLNLKPKNEQLKLNLSKPYLFGLDYDNQTALVGKKLEQLPNAEGLRKVVDELKAKAGEWNLTL